MHHYPQHNEPLEGAFDDPNPVVLHLASPLLQSALLYPHQVLTCYLYHLPWFSAVHHAFDDNFMMTHESTASNGLYAALTRQICMITGPTVAQQQTTLDPQ